MSGASPDEDGLCVHALMHAHVRPRGAPRAHVPTHFYTIGPIHDRGPAVPHAHTHDRLANDDRPRAGMHVRTRMHARPCLAVDEEDEEDTDGPGKRPCGIARLVISWHVAWRSEARQGGLGMAATIERAMPWHALYVAYMPHVARGKLP